MGRSPKDPPRRLAEKLLRIRKELGLSQNELIRRLGLAENFRQASVSGYELGTRVPPLQVLLGYADLAGVWVDVLIDDGLDLPDVLPRREKHPGVRRPKRRPARR